MVCVAFKGAKGACVAGCPCVRVPVRVCVCICAGVACVRDGVRVDGASGADNARAGRAGGRCLSVWCVRGVIVPCVLCVRV